MYRPFRHSSLEWLREQQKAFSSIVIMDAARDHELIGRAHRRMLKKINRELDKRNKQPIESLREIILRPNVDGVFKG